MSNLHTGNQTRLEDYPPGVQCLLKDVMWHFEQLDLLERDFRAWQMAQGETGTAVVYVNSQGQEVELFAPSTRGARPTRPKILPTESSIQPPPQCLTD